jgi:hypothetical protein
VTLRAGETDRHREPPDRPLHRETRAQPVHRERWSPLTGLFDHYGVTGYELDAGPPWVCPGRPPRTHPGRDTSCRPRRSPERVSPISGPTLTNNTPRSHVHECPSAFCQPLQAGHALAGTISEISPHHPYWLPDTTAERVPVEPIPHRRRSSARSRRTPTGSHHPHWTHVPSENGARHR